MSDPKCASCSLRADYDKNPKSLKGRLWRWHIRWCPGWKTYFRSLTPEEQKALSLTYGLNQH